MIQMKCVRPVPYEGRQLVAGETFEAKNELDAHVLISMGKAKRAKPESAISTREVVAQSAVAKTKRQYRRRDMTAQ